MSTKRSLRQQVAELARAVEALLLRVAALEMGSDVKGAGATRAMPKAETVVTEPIHNYVTPYDWGSR